MATLSHYMRTSARTFARLATSPGRGDLCFGWRYANTGTGPGLRKCSLPSSLKSGTPARTKYPSPGATKSPIVVPVIRVVPVAVGATGVTCIVVPRTAAQHLRPRPSERPRSPISVPSTCRYRHGLRGRSSSEYFAVFPQVK